MKRLPTRSLAYLGTLAVKAANKNIKKIVQEMAFIYKDWYEMLPSGLHEYCASVHISAEATLSFFLSIKHEGRASRGGESPIYRSSAKV